MLLISTRLAPEFLVWLVTHTAFPSTPPTLLAQAESAWKLACDGFIVYDIQDEAGRTTVKRPFPFRPTIDPSGFGQLLSECSGKQCVIYKSVGEPSVAAFDKWLNACEKGHGHNVLNLVGAATSKRDFPGAPP